MRTLKAELLIFIGFIFIFTGTIVLEKPFIIRTYEKAASFGFLCDVAMYRYEDCTPTHTDKGLCAPETYGSNELQKARIYNMSITDMQKRQGFVYEDEYTDPDYDALLCGPYGMMGVIEIPSIHVLLPVGHGTGTELLRSAAGHMHGTSLPIGGTSTHAVIAAHSGLADRELFTRLPLIQPGDEFYIYVAGEKHTYKVDTITICLPNETKALKVIEGKDIVTLMTCVPYGINTHRLFVRGTRCASCENQSESSLVSARRREYARSVLCMAGMFFLFAALTAIYTAHVYRALSRIRLNGKRSIL